MAAKLRDLGAAFGVCDDRFTPYCLRRGGATWHFTKYASYDATQHLGRWEHARTARLYIDQATAEVHELSLPEWGLRRMQMAKSCLGVLIDEAAILD